MTQLQKILTAVLLLQIAIGAWVFWPAADGATPGQPLLTSLAGVQIDRIEIEDGTGERLELSIDPTTNHWVHTPSGYSLTDGKITRFIDQLRQLQSGRLVTQTPASHARLQVADEQFNQKIRIWADGALQELLVGTAPNSRSVHVRLPNQDEVWLTDVLTSADVDPAVRNWLNTLYYSLERSDVVGLTIENESGTLRFERVPPVVEGDAPTWALQGLAADERLDQAAFGTLLSRATSVRFAEPLGFERKPSYQLNDPLATVTIELENGSRTLEIGAYDSESDSYVLGSDFSMVVRVPALTVADFVMADLEGLILQTDG